MSKQNNETLNLYSAAVQANNLSIVQYWELGGIVNDLVLEYGIRIAKLRCKNIGLRWDTAKVCRKFRDRIALRTTLLKLCQRAIYAGHPITYPMLKVVARTYTEQSCVFLLSTAIERRLSGAALGKWADLLGYIGGFGISERDALINTGVNLFSLINHYTDNLQTRLSVCDTKVTDVERADAADLVDIMKQMPKTMREYINLLKTCVIDIQYR